MLAHGFEVLVTVDQNLQYQQELRGVGISVVVLIANTNRIEDLRPLIARALITLQSLLPGTVVEIDSPAN